jgi:hypothetical protein
MDEYIEFCQLLEKMEQDGYMRLAPRSRDKFLKNCVFCTLEISVELYNPSETTIYYAVERITESIEKTLNHMTERLSFELSVNVRYKLNQKTSSYTLIVYYDLLPYKHYRMNETAAAA